ncbi:hypothetical protein M514_18734, partial [Trichuris suis]
LRFVVIISAKSLRSVLCAARALLYIFTLELLRCLLPCTRGLTMFRNTFQSGLLSLFYSLGNKPLQLWEQQTQNGFIRLVEDDEIQSAAIEVVGSSIDGACIRSIGSKAHFGHKATLFVELLDSEGTIRRFRANNFQSNTRIKPYICTIPLRLENGWNSVHFNLADFTKRAYGTNYVETSRVSVHANCRLRSVYFSDQIYAEDELPHEFRLSIPISSKSH